MQEPYLPRIPKEQLLDPEELSEADYKKYLNNNEDYLNDAANLKKMSAKQLYEFVDKWFKDEGLPEEIFNLLSPYQQKKYFRKYERVWV